MPIYEYKCQKCGEKFEQRVGFFHTNKSTKCPKCGSEPAERVFSPVSSNTSSCSTTGRYR
jgi:putative FmdB family regulatory protein